MHHYIFPQKDTYITNRSGFNSKNFGVDEILQIGTKNSPQRILSPTRDYFYPVYTLFYHQGFTYFTGQFTGSFEGNVIFASGSISGSNLWFSASYFTGSVNGTSSIISGSISGSSIIGYITGSIINTSSIGIFTGVLSGSDGCLTGTGSGVDTRNEAMWTTEDVQFIDRTLLKFDISAISKSISDGTIKTPRFSVKLKSCNEYDLPITYKVYAFPISQSWNMGDGYFSDGGSDSGVNWNYKDNNYGTQWYSSSLSSSRNSIDFISDPSLLTSSFMYGGGTWYTSSWCSQSFEYESSDIDMDVTPMVLGWISGSIPNEGMIFITSDELISTGSGFLLTFFSRDTNTIYSPYLDVMWSDATFNTGSFSTSSVTITSVVAGMNNMAIVSGSSIFFTSSISSSNGLNGNGINDGSGHVAGEFSSSTFLTFTQNATDFSASGFVNGIGLSGNITGVPVFGLVSASISLSSSTVYGECGSSFVAQTATGSFYNGPFSSSTFTAYYVDYKFENGFLYGPWISDAFSGSTVTIPFPPIYGNYGYAYITGPYVSGTALGTYTLDGPGSASYFGQFITGNSIGNSFLIQLTGSFSTSSYFYTSSISFTSSLLSPLDTERPFSIALQNIRPTYKAGDIAKIGVFGRIQFPLKHFGKTTQQEQYLVPEYLPTSSYYALKDNETDEIVMNFDSYTQIACEYPYGNYFVIDTTSLPQDRYYRVLIRVDDGQTIYTIDCGKTFKITR